jgi:hypothetical protein
VYSKSCGGPSVAKLTKLDLGELAPAFVVFARQGEHPLRAALRGLGTTQRAVLLEADAFLDGEAELLRSVGVEPPKAKSWFKKVFQRKRSDEDLFRDALEGRLSESELRELMSERGQAADRALPTVEDAARAKQKAEIRALVDEVFSGD